MSVQFKKRTKSIPSNLRPKSETNNVEDEEETLLTKKTKVTTNVLNEDSNAAVSSSVAVTFESNREIMPQAYAGDATYTTEIDTATDRDARAILGK